LSVFKVVNVNCLCSFHNTNRNLYVLTYKQKMNSWFFIS